MEKLFIEKTPTFDIGQTLECGQVFRFVKNEEGYRLYALDHVAYFKERPDCYEVETDDSQFFLKYLDFDTNYDIIQLKTQDKGLVSSAIQFGRGIHILRQDPIETIFSFLISQNNHIPRIKSIIERICDDLGRDCGGYRAFPTIDALASAGEGFYTRAGAGYRAAYLAKTAEFLAKDGVEGWAQADTVSLREKLTALHGVGRKVADCVLLFGFGRTDVFPVDTWILKIFQNEYPSVTADKLSQLLVERYGEYSGYVQQWLYYFKREEKKV